MCSVTGLTKSHSTWICNGPNNKSCVCAEALQNYTGGASKTEHVRKSNLGPPPAHSQSHKVPQLRPFVRAFKIYDETVVNKAALTFFFNTLLTLGIHPQQQFSGAKYLINISHWNEEFQRVWKVSWWICWTEKQTSWHLWTTLILIPPATAKETLAAHDPHF